jgi:hypothetical protein
MRVVDLYRSVLFLYPADFRNQFSEEMISVFQQRAAERPGAFYFFVREFSSIAKGACIMWLAKNLTRHPSPSEATDTTGTTLTISELDNQRQTAIRKMVASIARHDFLNARRYSNEETRLKRVLHDLEKGTPAPEMRQPNEPPFVQGQAR